LHGGAYRCDITARGCGKARGFADANRERSLKPILAWLVAQDVSLSAVSPVVMTKYFISAVVYMRFQPGATVWLGVWVPHPPLDLLGRHTSTEPPSIRFAAPDGNAPSTEFTKQEDLRIRKIDGVPAHGIRQTQTVADENDGKEPAISDTTVLASVGVTKKLWAEARVVRIATAKRTVEETEVRDNRVGVRNLQRHS